MMQMNTFEPYESYKDSGVEWLGEVPSHWKISKLKGCVKKNQRGNSPSYTEETNFPVINQSCVRENEIDFSKVKYNSEKPQELKGHLIHGDVLVCSTGGGTAGRVGYWDSTSENFIADSHVTILRANLTIFPRYMFYLLSSCAIGDQIKTTIKGATNQEELSNSELNRIWFIKPPLSEQRAIATFLDDKTAKIDAALTELERQRDLIEEMKRVRIHELVTKGLDPNVPMKYSGVEWIGEIPANTQSTKLKKAVIFDTSGEVIDKSYWHSGENLMYSAGKKPILVDYRDFPDNKKTKDGDILLARNGDGNVHIPVKGSIYTNVVQLIRISSDFDYKFVYYSILNSKHKVKDLSYGDIITSLNREQWFNGIQLVSFKLEEQKKIAKQIDLECDKSIAIMNEIDHKIATLKEYRKTLIHDVVTGKLNLKESIC
jgi:type I restriction enzyme S subunit